MFEKKLAKNKQNHLTTDAVLDVLREMRVTKINAEFFCGSFKRTEITDQIDELSKIPFCYEFISKGGLSQLCGLLKENLVQ